MQGFLPYDPKWWPALAQGRESDWKGFIQLMIAIIIICCLAYFSLHSSKIALCVLYLQEWQQTDQYF